MTVNAFYSMPTWRDRFWSALGFGERRAPRPDEDDPNWAPGWLMVGTRAHLDWKDRLRVLLTGNLLVEQVVQTDVSIERSRSSSAIGVLPFGAVKAPPPII